MNNDINTQNSEYVKPCRKCGAQDRNKSGKCKVCVAGRKRKYYEENRDQVAERHRKYYEANREKLADYQRQYQKANPDYQRKYYEANREKIVGASREYYHANPEKVAEYQRKYREANREKVIGREREYREANREKVAEYAREWQKANREKLAEHQRKWREANPEKAKAKKHNRRAKIKGNGGTLSPDIIQTLMVLQKGKCACCSKSLKDGHHLDHIMPIALGGKNTDDNVQLLTPKCNLRKSDKHPDDWARLNGRLL